MRKVIPLFAFFGLLWFVSPGQAASRLTVGLSGEPQTLDWNRAQSTAEGVVFGLIMEGLVSYDQSLRLVPALAESWSLNSDGRTYIFKIRPGVKWSDGRALSAKHFVYSWKRLLSPVTASPLASVLFEIEGAEFFNQGKITDFSAVGVHAVDDLTLKVKLVRPSAQWINNMTNWATFPLREDVVLQYGNSWDKPGAMVTLGRFLLISRDVNSSLSFVKNPNYYGTKTNVDQITLKIGTTPKQFFDWYKAGLVDVVELDDLLSLPPNLLKSPELKSFQQLACDFLVFVTDRYPMTSLNLRRAVAMAIDKSKIAKGFLGTRVEASSLVPPGIPGFSEKIGLRFDPIEAKKALRASGMSQNAKVKLQIFSGDYGRWPKYAELIAGELKRNLGLSVTVAAFERKQFRSTLSMRQYPMFVLGWVGDYPFPGNFLSAFQSANGVGRTGWKNEEYDNAVERIRNATDDQDRIRVAMEAQKILLENDVVTVPLFYPRARVLMKPRVKGLELNALGRWSWGSVQLAQ